MDTMDGSEHNTRQFCLEALSLPLQSTSDGSILAQDWSNEGRIPIMSVSQQDMLANGRWGTRSRAAQPINRYSEQGTNEPAGILQSFFSNFLAQEANRMQKMLHLFFSSKLLWTLFFYNFFLQIVKMRYNS